MQRIAWLFPGQGAQAVGMGKAVVEASAKAKSVFDRADSALEMPLTKLVQEGPEEELTLTANAQPAIVTTSIAVLEALREQLPELAAPSFVAGHSLGEYSAIVAANGMDLEDAVRVVRARGQAMQAAVPAGEGAMAAIMGLEAEVLETLCSDVAGEGLGVVSPANFNAPGQIVIAGAAKAVEAVSARVSDFKGRAIPLKVSAPFHCALMAPAAKVVGDALSAATLRELEVPVVHNVDAKPNRDASVVRDRLVSQVDGAVRWEQIVRFLVAEGVTHALEIGPGKVLAGLCKRTDKSLKVLSIGDAEGIAKVEEFLAS